MRACWVEILREPRRRRLRFRQLAVTEMEEGMLSGHRIALREKMQDEMLKGGSRSGHLQYKLKSPVLWREKVEVIL